MWVCEGKHGEGNRERLKEAKANWSRRTFIRIILLWPDTG
jgi:hypothetical protein